jgi:hypothetical protein
VKAKISINKNIFKQKETSSLFGLGSTDGPSSGHGAKDHEAEETKVGLETFLHDPSAFISTTTTV